MANAGIMAIELEPEIGFDSMVASESFPRPKDALMTCRDEQRLSRMFKNEVKTDISVPAYCNLGRRDEFRFNASKTYVYS